MMKKLLLVISLSLVLLLSACKEEGSIYNFNVRKDDYFISEDKSIIVEYKTDEDGKLVNLNIDRLLTIEEMIYYNPLIDYDYALEGFSGDIFIDPGYLCTTYNSILVPNNIEVGSIRYKYDVVDCEYQEVDRNNILKSDTYSKKYLLSDTIGVSRDTIISIVVYDENSIEKFVDIVKLPHTVKSIGVYSVGFNFELDGFSSNLTNYYKDIAIYEQLILKYQENDLAILELLGMSFDVNILDFDQFDNITPLIDDFEENYLLEKNAIDELINLIGIVIEEEVIPEVVPEVTEE